ncbi:hypothetical protein NFI96_033020 [Prochilodus magdalenae]|nr:hypothetical protein NFI96_033020 [Prochilodus magdalenae]
MTVRCNFVVDCNATHSIHVSLHFPYSGVMKAPAHQPVEGVQNHIEVSFKAYFSTLCVFVSRQNAVRRLKPLNEVTVSISSRTDTGVHALCNSAHLDILRKADKPPFTEKVLTEALNFFLKPEPIRITRAYRVPSDFHARYRAISRTYVYRLATGVSHHSEMPVTEKDLCWALRDTMVKGIYPPSFIPFRLRNFHGQH